MRSRTFHVMWRGIPGVAFLSASLLLSVSASAQATKQATAAVEQELMKLEVLWNDVATIKKDRATLEQILADDYFYTHSNGSTSNKAQEIADTMSSQWTSSKTDVMKVRVFGDVAIVTGRQVLLGTTKGYVSGPRRFTDLFVRRNGKWLVLGGQSTVIPGE